MKYPYKMLIRGEYYFLTKRGYIVRTGIKNFIPTKNWRIYGVSFHHWRNTPDLYWEDIKEKLNQNIKIKGYLWDIDNGTIRVWGGMYNGKIPKVEIFKN